MKYLKHILALIVLSTCLAGCGNASQEVMSDNTGSGNLTKGEWIGLLGEGFGYDQPYGETAIYSDVKSDHEFYDQIQACAEWEVINEQGTFQPDQEASWDYALQTAVRAIGLDNIESAGKSIDENELVSFFGQNIADISSVDLNSGIALADAQQLITYALDYKYNLNPIERFDYIYNEGVYEVAADSIILRGDGMTAIVHDGAVYHAGDIIYVEPSQNSTAYALRVTDASENEISYVLAEMEDVYSELHISGTYEGIIVSVDGADEENTEVSYRNNLNNGSMFCYGAQNDYQVYTLAAMEQYQAVPVGFSVNGNSVKFEQSLGKNGKFEISISNIQVKTDIDFGLFSGLKKADATVSFDDKIQLSYTAEHYSKSINLGKVTVNIGTTPCAVEISLVLNIGMDGNAELTYTSTVVGNVSYKKDAGLSKSVKNNNQSFDFHAQVTVTAEPTIKADLQLLSKSIANLKVTSGVVAIATVDVDLLGNQPSCIDIYLYVPLRWAVNEDGCVMTAISSKLKYSKTEWDSENSPVNKRFHFEDLVETPNDECTRGQNNAVETDTVDEEGQPYDEYKLFDFEEISFEIIKLVTTQINLEEGASLAIGFVSIPSGFQMTDLVYTVEDASICRVDGGIVYGTGNGSTIVKITTPDRQYSTFVAVTVTGGYNDTSGFQDL